ncbi:MAG TPA: fibronectin type III-like domain-contianing protein [Nocardioidaceae bacterium]|nr:fibronectin type III-like domain-contianing protein [Nocardioidaceae bacterium]
MLLEALTLEEKISLLAGDEWFGASGRTGGHIGTSDGVPRVGLPTTYYTDGPTGVRRGSATAMPAPIGLAATLDPGAAFRHGGVIGTEARFKGNDVIYAPTVNIMRTPLAGRAFEGYGEDPFLAARMAVGWLRGVQDQEKGLPVAYPYGHGLSYTKFAYRDLVVTRAAQGVGATVEATVVNTGDRRGAAVPQLYVQAPSPGAGVEQPPRQLKGFTKVRLRPGESRRVSFRLGRRAFAHWDTAADGWRVHPGCYGVLLGSSSRDIRLRARVPVRCG